MGPTLQPNLRAMPVVTTPLATDGVAGEAVQGAVLQADQASAQQEPDGVDEIFREDSDLFAVNSGKKEDARTFIHRYVSARSFRNIVKKLVSISTSKASTVSRFDVEDVITNGRRVLSLGEGGSSFVATMIQSRAEYLGIEDSEITFENVPFMALDIMYGEKRDDGWVYPFTYGGSFGQNREASLAAMQVIPGMQQGRVYQDKYPANYFHGFVNDFNIIDPKTGERILFDEIVSLVCLGALLNNFFEKSEEEGEAVLRNIVMHLRPGGIARIYPLNHTLFNPVFRAKLNNALAKMKAEGLIETYNEVGAWTESLQMKRSDTP